MFKHQEQFATELTESWINGNKKHVRDTIRNLKNKAQASFIAASVHAELKARESQGVCQDGSGSDFVRFMHPNNS